MLKDGALTIDPKDDIIKGSMVINAGQVVHGPTVKAIEGPAAAPAGAKA
jgi:hypothetical protein